MNSKFEIIYKGDFDDFDSELKGYRNDVLIMLPSGKYYELFFYDAHRIGTEINSGDYLAHPGMILLDVVNKAAIQKAVEELYEKGFFNYFVPIEKSNGKHFDENI